MTILQVAGGTATFIGLLVVTALAWLFMWRMAQETKGRPLDAIKELWENGGSWPASTSEAEAATDTPATPSH
ncbi:hypothetical protein OG395_12315 [Streptomyces sp. NBC_01320]|nr:hypothetical protein OG395_12315 [Streptomyces sp. NBC_01320]